MFHDEIGKMVAETFGLAEEFNGHLIEDFQFDQQLDINQLHNSTYAHEFDDNENLPDEVPGFFYNLEQKSSTFVLRILESDNLAADYQRILQFPEDYPTLRLIADDGIDPLEKLEFFECDTKSIAVAVRKQLSNKRFPVFEEHVLNISDPGDSWWIKCEENELSIYFKLSRTEQIDKLVKIGPLGDIAVATANLRKFYALFSMIFPVEAFSCAHGQFTISTMNKYHPYFQELISLFKTGNVNHDFWVHMWNMERGAKDLAERHEVQSAIYYLMELSVMRRFWCMVQEKLN